MDVHDLIKGVYDLIKGSMYGLVKKTNDGPGVNAIRGISTGCESHKVGPSYNWVYNSYN